MYSIRLLLTIGLLLGGLGGLLTATPAAVAQYPSAADRRGDVPPQTFRQRRGGDRARSEPSDRNQGIGAVPDWAESYTSPSREEESLGPDRSASRDITTNAPGFPNEPAKAPVGPTGWLAILGLGYGILRLRSDPILELSDSGR